MSLLKNTTIEITLKTQLELLDNLKYQNLIIFKNERMINDTYTLIKYIKYKVDDCYEKVNTNNILLVCIFILQIFILFK